MAWIEVADAGTVTVSDSEVDGSVGVDSPALVVCGFGMISL